MRMLIVALVACGSKPPPASPPSNAAPIAEPAPAEEVPRPRRALPGSLELRKIETQVKTYRVEKGDLPPSAAAMPGPPSAICSSTSVELPARPQADWLADPGWAALGFWVDGPSRVSYTWTRTSATTGTAVATADLDCDGIFRIAKFEMSVDANGNLVTFYPDPTAD